jgi:serpin B
LIYTNIGWKSAGKVKIRIFQKTRLGTFRLDGRLGDKSNFGTGGFVRHLKKALLVALVASFVLSACSSLQPKPQVEKSNLPRNLTPQVPASDLTELAGGNNEFAFALCRQISSGDKNLFYSPYSISIALAMTYSGAKGQTAEQMAQALHFSLPDARLHLAFNKLALELESRSKVEGLDPDQAFQLNVANSLWGQSGFHFERDFLDTLAQNYAAGMRLVDYRKDPEAARRAINDWVSRSTGQRIKDVIPPDVLSTLTRLVLANAVYFKAAWQYPFKPEDTKPAPFHLLDGSSVDVSMMRMMKNFDSMQGEGFRFVELPYAGWSLSMWIILPDAGRFRDVESRLDAGILDSMEKGRTSRKVHLTMPKFKFEWSSELMDGLKALGMRDAFDGEKADFSGMTGGRDLFIQQVLQKTFISVDEKGTEAAASTVVIAPPTAPGPSDEMEFTVDRPFIFLIRDNPTETILFVGRVINPSA